MIHKQKFYQEQAATIIKGLEKRNMTGIYFPTGQEAHDYLMAQIPSGAKVGVGGTQGLEQVGVKASLSARDDIELYMRQGDMTYADMADLYMKSFSADYYLMSTNAITLDGELINIDGLGNRTACLIYGPKKVIILAGMNKVAPSEEAALERARNIAGPANAIRLNKNTPCTKTGKCHNCMSPDCICSQIVYTRYSGIPDRIQVILVGEEIGY